MQPPPSDILPTTELTLRGYLILKVAQSTPLYVAVEAVSSVAENHPEWCVDDVRTWEGWEAWTDAAHNVTWTRHGDMWETLGRASNAAKRRLG